MTQPDYASHHDVRLTRKKKVKVKLEQQAALNNIQRERSTIKKVISKSAKEKIVQTRAIGNQQLNPFHARR
jgi:hypothetical protein